jgi:hypothetical protein
MTWKGDYDQRGVEEYHGSGLRREATRTVGMDDDGVGTGAGMAPVTSANV